MEQEQAKAVSKGDGSITFNMPDRKQLSQKEIDKIKKDNIKKEKALLNGKIITK